MNFEDLKDQLREQFQELWAKIQENELFIQLKERYDGLTPEVQKIINFTSIAIVVYFIYSIPASFSSSSSTYEENFIENRQLTRDLIRAGRLTRDLKMPPPAPDFPQMQSNIERILTENLVLEEQKSSLTQKNDVAGTDLVSKSFNQTGARVVVKKLNLKQLVKIAEDVSKMPSSELINMAVQADTKDPHYFNVDYEVAAFSVPFSDVAGGDSDANEKSDKKKPKRGGKRK
ncbi:MAG: hypothetical protein KDD33_10095 [Bdellovibrionales bacterium]|nr:hypothetical protein [Bdellovibrionales bacterium]